MNLTWSTACSNAGLARRTVKTQEFIGKQAYLKQAAERSCGNSVHAHCGQPHLLLRRAEIHASDVSPCSHRMANPIVDSKGRRSFVTSAGAAPCLGKHLLMTYLPPEFAREGTKLKVEYFSELYPATVAVAGSTPLFDPANERMKGRAQAAHRHEHSCLCETRSRYGPANGSRARRKDD